MRSTYTAEGENGIDGGRLRGLINTDNGEARIDGDTESICKESPKLWTTSCLTHSFPVRLRERR